MSLALGLTFGSVLAEPITAYVKARDAMGCRFAGEARSLRLLDRFLVAQRVATLDAISGDVIDAFLASRPGREARAYNDLLGAVRPVLRVDGRAADARRLARSSDAPPRGATSTAALFSVSQMRQLLDLARQFPDRNRGPRRGPTYCAIFAVYDRSQVLP